MCLSDSKLNSRVKHTLGPWLNTGLHWHVIVNGAFGSLLDACTTLPLSRP